MSLPRRTNPSAKAWRHRRLRCVRKDEISDPEAGSGDTSKRRNVQKAMGVRITEGLWLLL